MKRVDLTGQKFGRLTVIECFGNVNGNYEPSNCRWATMKEQGNNRRNNVKRREKLNGSSKGID